MFEKKDPGKFTVRFNMADPQQRTVIELLNQQGRYKAQFLTSAILHYVHCSETPDIRKVPSVGSEEIERIVRSVLAQQHTFPPQESIQKAAAEDTHPREATESQLPKFVNPSEDADREAIFKTLDAFRPQS